MNKSPEIDIIGSGIDDARMKKAYIDYMRKIADLRKKWVYSEFRVKTFGATPKLTYEEYSAKVEKAYTEYKKIMEACVEYNKSIDNTVE